MRTNGQRSAKVAPPSHAVPRAGGGARSRSAHTDPRPPPHIPPGRVDWRARTRMLRTRCLRRGSCAALLLLLYVVLAGPAPAACLNNGLGRTPPMGFNTWNYFGCDINEDVLQRAAEQLVALGLADAGYTFVNIDDCMLTHARDADGQLVVDPIKFPSGMRALGDFIRAKGLRLGVYSDAGLLTCAGFPGSRFHEEDDAALFASWGVDYLKYDNCFAPSADVRERYVVMRDALNKTGRDIYFSMCEWGVASPWEWAQDVANSWRTDADIAPTWDSILRCLDNGAAGLAQYAGPGGWNDPDMLEVGNGALTVAQQRSHFALWAIVKSPLLIGANLQQLGEPASAQSLGILKSHEVIAVNQDALGVAADLIWKEGPAEVWAGPLSGDDRVVALFNRHHAGPRAALRVSWAQLGWDGGLTARVRDLFAARDLGAFQGGFEARVACFDVLVLRISPCQPPSSQGRAGASGAAWLRLPAALARALACRVAPAAAACASGGWGGDAASGCVPRQPHAAADVVWRPWHSAEAAQLQARAREAARLRRAAAAEAAGAAAARQ